LSLSDTLGLKHTVATFRKGVRAVQMVGRASMYSACLLGHTHTHTHTYLCLHIFCKSCILVDTRNGAGTYKFTNRTQTQYTVSSYLLWKYHL